MTDKTQHDKDELVHLLLRQARRREIPFRLFKCFISAFLISIVIGTFIQLVSCSDRKPTPVEQKKPTAEMWRGHSDAMKRRIP